MLEEKENVETNNVNIENCADDQWNKFEAIEILDVPRLVTVRKGRREKKLLSPVSSSFEAQLVFSPLQNTEMDDIWSSYQFENESPVAAGVSDDLLILCEPCYVLGESSNVFSDCEFDATQTSQVEIVKSVSLFPSSPPSASSPVASLTPHKLTSLEPSIDTAQKPRIFNRRIQSVVKTKTNSLEKKEK